MFILAFKLEDVLQMINNALMGLTSWICEFIYTKIAELYKVFLDMGSMLYTDNFSVIYNKISLIIGIFMIFRVTFWLIEILVNPDYISDKEKAPVNIVKKVLLVVILLATTPRLFKIAYNVQYEIINRNLIGKALSPTKKDAEMDSTKIGRELSANLFVNFYTMNKETSANPNYELCSGYAGREGYYYRHLSGEFADDENAGKLINLSGNSCLTYKQDVNTSIGMVKANVVNFDGIMATAVGIFVLWMMLMYCISVGSRYAQLIFLQIISPIPIMCYLTPKKDNMFSKWVKQCTTTYLDLFIRVAIINFAMLLISMLLGENGIINEISASVDNNLISIFLVLGLLTFAKKAPDLIQELLPKSVTKASGDFGLSWKKRTEAMLGGKLMYNATKRAPGFVAGGITGAAVGGYMGAAGGKGFGSRLAGLASGAARGFGTGSKKGNVFKNIGEVRKNQAAQNSKLEQWRIAANKGENEPNTFRDYLSRKSDANRRAMGFETNSQNLERRTKVANEAADSQKNVLEYGKGKSKEKNTKLTAFGQKIGISELESRYKQATASHENMSIEKLMSTPEGDTRLKITARNKYNENVKASRMARGETEAQAISWMQSHSSYLDKNFETTYNSMSETDKYSLAQEAMQKLSDAKEEAKQAFLDGEKKAAFSFLVDDRNAQNVKNDFTTITEFLKGDKEFAADVCADYIKRKKGLKPGSDDYKNYAVDSSEITDDVIDEMFNLEKLSKLKAKAETPQDGLSATDAEEVNNAMGEFEAVYSAFDMFKTLKARYAAKGMTPEALRDKANDKFNSSK